MIDNNEPTAEVDATAEVVEATAAAASCIHCAAVPVLCEEHAGMLVAQAFAEDAANNRESAARAAERALRKGSHAATRAEDAQALRHVLVRWHGRNALEVARALVALLESEQ